MLEPVHHHSWDLSPKEAIALQKELAQEVKLEDAVAEFDTVAGVDVGIKERVSRAAIVVLSYPQLEFLTDATAERPVSYPYVPGLLTFREAPVILDALTQLTISPDVLIFDGQGYAHPRRMGLATHMGLLLDHPTVGCAKSRLCGEYEEPGLERGAYSWLKDKGEIIGAVLRTRTNVKPLFVSPGHLVSLSTAIELVLGCGGGYKLPETTRWAHRVASEMC